MIKLIVTILFKSSAAIKIIFIKSLKNLVKENFLSTNFVKLDFETYYSKNQLEIANFSIINISKDLKISKETTRRKILELEKNGLIIKNKKAIHMQKLAYNIKKPEDSIEAISKFMSNLSKLFKKNNIVINEISTKDFTL